jgi:hypothetical protein
MKIRTDCQSIEVVPPTLGSLFQSEMEPGQRRRTGGHYTAQRDILRVIRSLFLDDLRAEFERHRQNKTELSRLHERLGRLRIFDPACGCGDFLAVAYRELRLLEIDILQALRGDEKTLPEVSQRAHVDLGAIHGIEIQEEAVRIAEAALRRMDRQMDGRLWEAFGPRGAIGPPTSAPTIVRGNALRLDWRQILPPEQCVYVLGNPPFAGKQFMTACQKDDMKKACGEIPRHGTLDYACGWYFKAAQYVQGTQTTVGFVSTNSIVQGEQTGVLWNALFRRFHVKIRFGHRPFAWESEAPGKAHVHVVIVGFGAGDAPNKRLYEYPSTGKDAVVTHVANISPYLTEGSDMAILPRPKPRCGVPPILFGNMPNDGGHLILDDEQKAAILRREPKAERFVRPFLGAAEFLSGRQRWCLWLKDALPAELHALPEIMKRVEAVRVHRLSSPRSATRRLASRPALFGEIRQPDTGYLFVPSVSSQRRRYIPMAFMAGTVIASNLALIIPGAARFHFGVLSSAMHMAWVRTVCGRLKSDFRYSNKLVYNNFPWPEDPDGTQIRAVEGAAEQVLEARRESPGASYADLYDPLTMPAGLIEAHRELDRAVDRCYGAESFATDRRRAGHLLALYERASRATPTIDSS